MCEAFWQAGVDMLKYSKPIADLLTKLRVVLGLYVAWLGISRGPGDLSKVVWAVIVSWITDILDGPLARRDPRGRQTWIGEHDAEADLTTSIGLSIYLIFERHMAAWLGVIVLMIMLGLWALHSYQLAWPFYALPYVVLVVVASKAEPLLGWALLLYLAGVLLVRWRRLKTRYLPEFFDAVRALSVGRWSRN